ncbi:MAG: helix-turn-helix transcriptional regulator [Gammaproteobacteria bacterium]|nr:helix-turn-helix transcriptional regulator [Gammaproteobacteria bacterium]
MSGHELIKTRRNEAGLSLRKLGELTGIHFTYIKGIENGLNKPTIDKTLALLHVLGITTEEYFKAIGYTNPEKGMVAVQGIEPRTLTL